MTPGSGFVAPRRSISPVGVRVRNNNPTTAVAMVYGVLGATLCSMTTRLFAYVGIEDSLDASGFLYLPMCDY